MARSITGNTEAAITEITTLLGNRDASTTDGGNSVRHEWNEFYGNYSGENSTNYTWQNHARLQNNFTYQASGQSGTIWGSVGDCSFSHTDPQNGSAKYQRLDPYSKFVYEQFTHRNSNNAGAIVGKIFDSENKKTVYDTPQLDDITAGPNSGENAGNWRLLKKVWMWKSKAYFYFAGTLSAGQTGDGTVPMMKVMDCTTGAWIATVPITQTFGADGTQGSNGWSSATCPNHTQGTGQQTFGAGTPWPINDKIYISLRANNATLGNSTFPYHYILSFNTTNNRWTQESGYGSTGMSATNSLQHAVIHVLPDGSAASVAFRDNTNSQWYCHYTTALGTPGTNLSSTTLGNNGYFQDGSNQAHWFKWADNASQGGLHIQPWLDDYILGGYRYQYISTIYRMRWVFLRGGDSQPRFYDETGVGNYNYPIDGASTHQASIQAIPHYQRVKTSAGRSSFCMQKSGQNYIFTANFDSSAGATNNGYFITYSTAPKVNRLSQTFQSNLGAFNHVALIPHNVDYKSGFNVTAVSSAVSGTNSQYLYTLKVGSTGDNTDNVTWFWQGTNASNQTFQQGNWASCHSTSYIQDNGFAVFSTNQHQQNSTSDDRQVISMTIPFFSPAASGKYKMTIIGGGGRQTNGGTSGSYSAMMHGTESSFANQGNGSEGFNHGAYIVSSGNSAGTGGAGYEGAGTTGPWGKGADATTSAGGGGSGFRTIVETNLDAGVQYWANVGFPGDRAVQGAIIIQQV